MFKALNFAAFRLATALLLAALPLSVKAQPANRDILLQTEGILEVGDNAFPNGALFDEYTFAGRAGQIVLITLESDAFDTYLVLIDSEDQVLAENDDWNTETNSTIVFELPADGVYRIWANAFDASGQGVYRVTVSLAERNDPIVREAESDGLTQQGSNHMDLGEYPEALTLFQQALAIRQDIEDQRGVGEALNNIGSVYSRQGDYPKALDFYRQSLKIHRDNGDQFNEAVMLNNIGLIHNILGEYPEALEFYEQALALRREVDDRYGEGITLNNIGFVYNNLGNYSKALEFYERSLAIHQAVQNAEGVGDALSNIGSIYAVFENYPKALEFHEQALAIRQEASLRRGIGESLNNIGGIYDHLEDYSKALEFYEQSLTITQEIGDRRNEGVLLNNIGHLYDSLGEASQALDFYQQSLAVRRDIGDIRGEGITLNNIGYLQDTLDNPALAIVYLKQSVNRFEIIRTNNQAFTVAEQQSFSETIASPYRKLADLLLEQGRVLEAQQVLELLKVKELRDYTDDERTGDTLSEVILLPQEQAIISTYITLVEFGKQLQDCEATEDCSDISTLRDRRDQLFNQYREAVKTLGTFVADRLQAGDDPDLLLNPTGFANQAEEIIAQQPGTVVIYPLVLDDKLWLLWATEGRIVSRREIPVSRLELGKAVIELRSHLENRYSDINEIKSVSKQLYDWLITPIEDELAANQDIEHLVFSLDRTTRYLPMAALYDGEQYLIEKYTVANILSAGLTDTDSRTPTGTEVNVLAAGVAAGSEKFSALPYVLQELDGIVREVNDSEDTEGVYPGQQLLDDRFSFRALRDALGGSQFLHIATHGEFIPGRRDQSYLLMGDGQELPIPQIETLGTYLEDVHLVVLSACQTALGGPDEEGLEIAGLSYYFLKSQVDAVMASLWNVSDSSTSRFMQQFYETLATGTADNPITKAEALQQTQLAMLRSNEPGGENDDRWTILPQNDDAPRPAVGVAHPYYWAPFTVIGNSL